MSLEEPTNVTEFDTAVQELRDELAALVDRGESTTTDALPELDHIYKRLALLERAVSELFRQAYEARKANPFNS